MDLDNDNKEYCTGAFFGFVAGVLVLALTAMAFTALTPPPAPQFAVNWELSIPQPSGATVPGFGA